jgi:hypothetical protein
VFPSKEAFIKACLKDYNKVQNLTATEVINNYELQKQKEVEVKTKRKEKEINKTATPTPPPAPPS